MKETINLIPELFYDIISRFVPATVLLVIYFPEYLSYEFNFQTTIFLIFLIYIIGFLLGNFGSIIWSKFYFDHPILIKLVFSRKVKYYTSSEIWKYTLGIIDEKEKNGHKKLIAEYVMFRSLSIQVFFFLFYRPDFLNDFTNLEFFFFLFIWWFVFSFSKLHLYRATCILISKR